jgi:PAS domain S-box-containing protein
MIGLTFRSHSVQDKAVTQQEHYLEGELTQLLRTDPVMWQFLQQGSLDGVWYWDLENPENEWMSREFWQLLGIDPATKQHKASEWQGIIDPDDLKVAVENFKKHCDDPSHPYDQIVRYRHADGSTVWVRCRGLAIRDETGKPIRMLGAHNDLTASKVSEEELRTRTREAEHANDELRSFAYSMSHDLKSPTNTLELLLTELQTQHRPDLAEDALELLEMSVETVHRMKKLIEDVLHYTRAIGDHLPKEPVDLNDVLTDVLGNMTADVETSGAKIDVGPLPTVQGDAIQLGVVFQNLIGNALKYQPEGNVPVVEIHETSKEHGKFLAVTVSDNGIGIAPKDQEKIFGMFQRLHLESEYPGTGLGLATCRRIALAHGGDISVESETGKGTAFTVTFPRP